jgi:hypothetical protein
MGPGALDGGAPDAGSRDAGPLDAAAHDAGPLDAGVRDAGPLDAPPSRDAGLDAGRSVDAGTSTDALPVCGDFIVQGNEACDFPQTLPELCVGCQLTDCGNCFIQVANVPTTAKLCAGLNDADTVACNQLATCLAGGIGRCAARRFGADGCLCSDPASGCSTGLDGPCAAAYEALAHSTDPATLFSQIRDRTTPVGRLSNDAVLFAGACGSVCAHQM